MKLNRFILPGLIAAAFAQSYAQPVITEAVNTAGYMKAGLPNGGLAQGSYIAIKGTNLGPAIPASGIAVSGYPLTTNFSGVTAKIGTTDLIIVYAIPTQIGAIVPSNTPLGAGNLTVTYAGQTSVAFAVTVVDRALGIFTLNQNGTGPVVALKFISQGSQPPTTLLEALNPNGTLTLFGTGLGRSNNPDTTAATDLSIPGLTANDIEVLIGGKRAQIQFFGRSSCCSSIDQIVATIPADTPTGCYVSLVVRVAGKTSNSTTISVAPPGKSVCSDPNGYTETQLTEAAARGTLRQGYIGLAKATAQISTAGFTLNQSTDLLSGNFYSFDMNQLVRAQGSDTFLSVGSCRVVPFEGESATVADPIRPTGLDAGTALTAQNSNGGQTLEKIGTTPGNYLKSIVISSSSVPLPFPIPGVGTGTEYLTTGNHTVTGPGGPNVGAFSASVNWPAVFAWTNRDAIASVNRASGVTVNWSGGDPQGFVSIYGFSIVSISGKNIGAGFVCLEAANKGTMAVPSAITSSLPASATIQGTPLGALSVTGISRIGNFTASGLDVGYVSYSSGSIKTLAFQ